jgi:hypothetical protein
LTPRTYGARGKVLLPFWTEEVTAKSGRDFVQTSGDVVFDNEDTVKTITVDILREDTYEKNVLFNVVLGNIFAGSTYVSFFSSLFLEFVYCKNAVF